MKTEYGLLLIGIGFITFFIGWFVVVIADKKADKKLKVYLKNLEKQIDAKFLEAVEKGDAEAAQRIKEAEECAQSIIKDKVQEINIKLLQANDDANFYAKKKIEVDRKQTELEHKLALFKLLIDDLELEFPCLSNLHKKSILNLESSADLPPEYLKEDWEREFIFALAKDIHQKTTELPWLAKLYAQCIEEAGEIIAGALETKKNPALKSAEEVRAALKRAAKAEEKAINCQALVNYYESIFPDLEEFEVFPGNIEGTELDGSETHDDKAKNYLGADEWENKTPSEKFQLALNRFINRKKTNWEIGREFERYIGYLYEIQGYKVTYFGAIEKLKDLGRDLIAQKGKEIKIIQCKYWAKDKVIHEKHLFQLYGTAIVYGMSAADSNRQKDKNVQLSFFNQEKAAISKLAVTPVFITSCEISSEAKKFAELLGIEVQEYIQLDNNWPRIKCNVSKDGDKIFHLPFDQQYDKILIEPNKGEFFAHTVEEAMEAGFRRAYRWHGNG